MLHNCLMDLQEIRLTLQRMMPDLRQRYGVGGLWVFGSRALNAGRSDSDLDLLVEFERSEISLFRFVGLEQEIADRLGVKVDLVERSAIRPELASSILKDAVSV